MAGTVREYPSSSPGEIGALLYDFETNSDRLLDAHTRWLDQRIIFPYLRNHTFGTMWIRGSASRLWTGARTRASAQAHNQSLSERRAEAVQLYLESRDTNCRVYPLRSVTATGSTRAFGASENDEADRSVEIRFQPTSINIHQPPSTRIDDTIHHPPPHPLVSNRFRLRVILGVGVDLEAVGAGGMSIEIEDVINQWAAVYDLREIHASLSVGSPVNVSAAGPWNSFTTTRAIGVAQLGGLVRLGSAGVTVPVHIPFTNRTSISFGISFIVLQPHMVGVSAIRIEPFQSSSDIVVLPSAGGSYGAGSMGLQYPPLPSAQMPWPFTIH